RHNVVALLVDLANGVGQRFGFGPGQDLRIAGRPAFTDPSCQGTAQVTPQLAEQGREIGRLRLHQPVNGELAARTRGRARYVDQGFGAHLARLDRHGGRAGTNGVAVFHFAVDAYPRQWRVEHGYPLATHG